MDQLGMLVEKGLRNAATGLVILMLVFVCALIANQLRPTPKVHQPNTVLLFPCESECNK